MPDHRITRSVVMEDGSFTIDCSCELRFFGKDRAATMQEWKKHTQPLQVVK